MEIKVLLGCSVLRFYEDFIQVLKKEPSNAYSDEKKHPFVASLIEALTGAEVSTELFQEWQKYVTIGFKCKNAFALAIPDLLDATNDVPDPNQLLTDPRCIIEAINNLSHVARVNSENLVTMIDNQNYIINKMEKLESSIDEMHTHLKVIEQNWMPDSKKRKIDDVEACIIPWSATMKLVGKATITPLSLFEMWFTKDMRAGYELEGNRQENDRKKFNKQKKIMGVLLKFVEEYPPNKPKKYDELKEWKLKLNQIGSIAIQGAIQAIGTKDDKITCTRVIASLRYKTSLH